ncbi:HNH endonuclease family protein [Rhodococcus tibetensis]|uniref:HNH endonuclease family protein n=1 Tax=Rhodococcus tibetensis TaxID=2965064 RepID=A0ABT1QIB7_9NOCA|nr:HNH endonuclease family protein [Rhodococcus sp. FXJ9.536]MCQ4122034.1 HNH endonuclease family protein [Rhodococcus sp. FXJ9.536]
MRVLYVLVGALAVGGCGVSILDLSGPGAAPGSPPRAHIEQLLAQVETVESRPHPGGYQRGCAGKELCVFGPAWTDAQNAPAGHDGCDTRNNVLATDLRSVSFRDGTRECVVLSGVLADPYSGEVVDFDRSDAKAVQIDHVYPLAAAWDMGASTWPLERRLRFANDTVFNLLAVNGDVNQDKGDQTPGDWLPPNSAYHCFYAGKYLTVAVEYGLPVTAADRRALADVAERCP